MRVLYLNSLARIGGTETSLLNLLEGLRELHPAWHLGLLLGEDGPLALRAANLCVEVCVLPLPSELAAFGDASGVGFKEISTVPTLLPRLLDYRRRLSTAIRAWSPNVVHSNGIKMHLVAASLTKESRDTSWICHMHDYARSRPLSSHLLKSSFGRFDAVVANSASVAADLAHFPNVRRKLTFIHNGVDLDRFAPSGNVLDLDVLSGFPPDRELVRVGLMASFAKWKGHTTFLRAIAQVPANLPVRAYIIGGPIYRTSGSQYSVEYLRHEAACQGVQTRVGFTGVVESTAAALRALDIVVHASILPEPFGMVIAEAMACGKPVIVSSGGGAAELFDDGVTALGHSPGDAEMLARQIECLVRDRNLRHFLGRNARAFAVDRFNASLMSRRFADLYCRSSAAKSGAQTDLFAALEEKC